jgi:aminoglycoside phosphotransferase (APT) family kinase protein
MTDDGLALALAGLVGGEVTGLRRLSGGASRETWSFDGGGRPLILQRQRPGAGAANVTMATEVALLRAAADAGVAVPAVVADASDGVALGAPAFVVERLEGETIARKLLRDDEYAAVRPRVAAECGGLLAAIHRIPVDAVPGLAASDPLVSMRETLDAFGEPHPALELGLRWLAGRRPPAGRTAVVHGDFRTGNLMIDARRVVAVLDWELAHLGDPLEDLGWFCVRAWRFGVDDRPAGGFGSREELWAAYEAAGGERVDPDAARWWEVYGTLRWGVICIAQAASHRLGLSRSVELAAIGRRTCENEHDVLALVAPDREPPAPTSGVDGGVDGDEEDAGGFAPHDGPSVAELAEAVREWLEGDVAAGTEGRIRFHARVAANVMGMLERELRLGPDQAGAHRARLARLGVGDDAELASAIRAGALDDRWDEVVGEVWGAVVDKLAVAHPGYAERGA